MKNLFAISIVLIYSLNGYGQSNLSDSMKIDSLKKVLSTNKEDTNKVNTLIQIALEFYYRGNNHKAFETIVRAIPLAHTLNYKAGEGIAYGLIGNISLQEDNYNDAYKFLITSLYLLRQTNRKKAIPYTLMKLNAVCQQLYKYDEARQYLLEEINLVSKNKYLLAEVYFNLGRLARSQESFPDALKNLFYALQLSDETREKYMSGDIFQEIGYTYFDQQNYKAAIKNYNDALNVFQIAGDESGVATCNKNMGDAYLGMHDYKNAFMKEQAALKIFEKLKSKSWVAFTYSGIGNILEAEGVIASHKKHQDTANRKFTEALRYYLLALELNNEIHFNLDEAFYDLGSIYIHLNRFQEAKANLKKSLQEAEKTNYKEIIKSVYLGFSKIDSAQGNYKQGFEDYKIYISNRDSLNNVENTKKIAQAQMQYDFDKKEAIAKAAQDKKDADTKRIKNQQYFAIEALGIVVLAVIIIALIQFRSNKHKQKANLALQLQKEKVEITLSELKSTQAQLIQSEKMASLGELTAGIAHEIQNPLNFVNNFSEVNKEMLVELKAERLKPTTERDEENENEIINDVIANEEKINHHGKRADAIVKGMLQHSRISTGVKEPTNINALCDEYLRLSYHGLRAKDKSFNATMKTDFDESIGKINIIPQDMGRVLLNLYNNAFYAVADKGRQLTKDLPGFKNLEGLQAYEPTVSVTTKKSENRVLIAVSDNGNGIPQKILDKIFQPFFTTKPTGEGTGLGLSLSYDIVKAHGGEIKVESKEGEGIEFIIQLPVA